MKQTELAQYLERTPSGWRNPLLTKEEAAVRASVVCAAMDEIGLNLEIKTFPAPTPYGVDIEVAYYDLPMSEYGQEKPDETGCATRTTCGSGYTWGDVFQLSKACIVGARLLPAEVWPMAFKEDLTTNRHYACIQELLWLGKFKQPEGVQHAAKPFCNCKKDVDWRFKCQSQVINLEVKYRPADWTKLVDGPRISPSRVEDFHDVRGKFPVKNADELNLLGVTSMAPLDASLEKACNDLLKEMPTLDGVLVWTHAPENGYTAIYSEQRGYVRLFFNEGDREDRMFYPAIFHQWEHSAHRRGKLAAEVNQELVERLERKKQGHSSQRKLAVPRLGELDYCALLRRGRFALSLIPFHRVRQSL